MQHFALKYAFLSLLNRKKRAGKSSSVFSCQQVYCVVVCLLLLVIQAGNDLYSLLFLEIFNTYLSTVYQMQCGLRV